MIEKLKSRGYYVESFERSQNYKLFSRLESLDNSIVLFDLIGDFQLNRYYKTNIDDIVKQFNDAGYNFTFLPGIDFPEISENLISYFIPHLNDKIHLEADQFPLHNIPDKKDDFKYFSSYVDYNKLILDYFGYKGRIKSGFVVCDDSLVHVIKYSNEEIICGVENPQHFIIDSGIKSKLLYDDGIFSSPRTRKQEFSKFIDESLDEETLCKIESINKEFNALKSSGKWLYILPLLKNTLEEMSDEVDLNLIGGVEFDDDYNIYIPYFNNLKIRLSSLSRVVYVLFYNHPDGIRISELWKYEKELLNLYLKISNQNDWDKMNQSIKDLIDLNSKAIFTHISRIKSAFYNAMEESYAKNYIIDGTGFGSDLKYIPLIFEGSKDESSESGDSRSWI